MCIIISLAAARCLQTGCGHLPPTALFPQRPDDSSGSWADENGLHCWRRTMAVSRGEAAGGCVEECVTPSVSDPDPRLLSSEHGRQKLISFCLRWIGIRTERNHNRSGWVNGWLSGWVNGWVNGWLGGWLNGWLSGWLSGWVNGWRNGWLSGWLSGWVNGWRSGWLSGWLSGWVSDMFYIPGMTLYSVDYSLLTLFILLQTGRPWWTPSISTRGQEEKKITKKSKEHHSWNVVFCCITASLYVYRTHVANPEQWMKSSLVANPQQWIKSSLYIYCESSLHHISTVHIRTVNPIFNIISTAHALQTPNSQSSLHYSLYIYRTLVANLEQWIKSSLYIYRTHIANPEQWIKSSLYIYRTHVADSDQ